MKGFLSRSGVQFTEKDVQRDPSAIDELRQIGAMATPVTVIDGHAIIGFDEQALRQKLGIGAAQRAA